MSKVSRECSYGSFIAHSSLPSYHARLNFGKSGTDAQAAAQSLKRGRSFASAARISPSDDSTRFAIRATVLAARCA